MPTIPCTRLCLTLVRLAVTKRRLLEWETAASAAARAAGLVRKGGLRHFAAEMVASPVAAAVVLTAMIAWRPSAIPVASPILVLWAMAPAIAYWLSVPVGARVRPLDDAHRALAATHGAQDVAVLRHVRR